MTNLSSKVIFGVGVALAVAAIASIFVSTVSTQAQQQGSQSSSSGATSTAGTQNQGGQQQSGGSSSGGQQSSANGGGGQQQQGSNGGSGGAATQITISQGAASQQTQQFYQPDPAQVSPGSQVTWQNKDSAPHTATADDNSFDTGTIQPGQSGSANIQGQGQIKYHCTIHPFMHGTLQVSAGGNQQQSNGGQQQQSGGATNAAQSSSQQSQGGQQSAQQSQSQQGSQQSQPSTQQGGSSQQQPQGQQQQSGGSQLQSSQSQSGQQSNQEGTQTSTASQGSGAQSSGDITQALQQAGQALVQAGNALQQAVGGGTSTAQQSGSSGQSQGNNNGGQQSSQGGNSQSQTTEQPQPSSSQQQSSQQSSGQQGTSSQSGGQSQQSSASGNGQQQAGGSQQTQTSAQQSQQQSSNSGGTTNQIDIPQGAQSGQNGYYSPASAQVSPGSKVTWNNKDSVAHTATAQDGSFDTGNIAPGSSGSATIQGQGQIQYYCTIHPWMTGTLNVGGSNGGSQQHQSGQQSAPQQSGGSQQLQQSSSQQNQQSSQGGGQQQQGGSGQSTSAGGFPIRTQATAFKVLPKSTNTDAGLEPNHKDDWVTANHDIYYTRSSQQTTIGKDNVNKLQVKWILNSDFPIENPPLIVGDRGYAQDNAMRVLAFDTNTGLNLWKFDPGVADKQNQQLPRGVFSHGITYDGGVIFAPTGANGTVVALNATDGKLIWQSASVGDPRLGYREPMPPIVWKDYVIAGSALGDEPPFAPAAKGMITAFNRTNGEKIWNISTVTGAWVEGENAKKNGGATIWSGGSFDPESGIMYLPTGNAAPDFNASSRPSPNPYTSSVIAVDVKNGHILWDTVSVSATDQHDWDTAWGTSLAKVKTEAGQMIKVVIAQNKRGEGFALNADDGKVLWNNTLGVEFRTDAQPTPYGSGEVWPGANYGVEDYNANDNNTAYFAVSNMGFNYFKDSQGGSGHLEPLFDSIENGIGNGTIVAVDIKTGKIKWEHPTEFPTWVSPAVTNGVVFSGHITATGKPYQFSDFGAPTETPLIPSGIILALDKDTGKQLWEFNVGAPIGIGGPSIGHGMLLVPTGSPAEVGSNKGGYIVAFGLPANDSGTAVSEQAAKLVNNTSSANATSAPESANAPTNASSSSSQALSQSPATASSNSTTTQAQKTSTTAENKLSPVNKTKS
jgi:plastocyanin/outer membrane protein assembly factor BamB